MTGDDGEATMRDVAEAAGVSIATVSRVLNGHPSVSESAGRKVRSAVESLSYKVNRAARILKTRESKIVGIIVPELSSEFFMLLAESLERKLSGRGYSLLVSSSYDSVEEEKRRLKLLTERSADAIVIVPATDRGAHLREFQRRDTPIVLIDRIADGCRADAVLADNEGGAYAATSALIADGHGRIGFIGGDPRVSTARERFMGYERAMREAGLGLEDDFVKFGPANLKWGFRAMEEMRMSRDCPKAFFAVNLYTHLGATDYLLSKEGESSADIVFAAFDEMAYSPLLTRCRYAVSQPIKEMGEAAAGLVLERLEGKRSGEPVVQRFGVKLIKH